MTITPKISIDGGNLVVHRKTVLKGVPENIVLTPGTGSGLVTGAFIGASATNSKSLHVFPVGVLEGLRFMCCFRFKLWWIEWEHFPGLLDWFGWCTWDAFYSYVTAEGVEEGLKSLSEGGTHPRFLTIDDGWQQIGNGNKDSNVVGQEGAQFANRLTGIKENEKFQKQKDDHAPGLRHVIDEDKENHNVKYVYVWHALAGYWGGVNPTVTGMKCYDPSMAYPVQSHGVRGN
nr:probable galactinol--sucrose galactosyltransferase 2 [Tanacetum cinerariifolium]